jgi:hypothetical protein
MLSNSASSKFTKTKNISFSVSFAISSSSIPGFSPSTGKPNVLS